MILECSEEVRLGMIRLLSASRVTGRSLVRGRVKDVGAVREGAMLTVWSIIEIRYVKSCCCYEFIEAPRVGEGALVC